MHRPQYRAAVKRLDRGDRPRPDWAIVTDSAALLRAYDDQLRDFAEVPNADAVSRFGPVVFARYGTGRGFVTYRDLHGYDGPGDGCRLDGLIAEVLEHARAQPGMSKLEWKTRGHDGPADLPSHLVAHGFVPDPVETVMVGEASALAVDVPLPPAYRVRRMTTEAELLQACETDRLVFGDSPEDTAAYVAELVARRRADPDDFEMWVAEHEEAGGWRIVCCGRLDPVADSDFAGIWGGGCLPEHRGRGLYRAITAARARSALTRGRRYIQSDCTEYSRPILARAGLVPITTTTPYTWRREQGRDGHGPGSRVGV